VKGVTEPHDGSFAKLFIYVSHQLGNVFGGILDARFLGHGGGERGRRGEWQAKFVAKFPTSAPHLQAEDRDKKSLEKFIKFT
jgi:hypothetical protein